MARDFHGGRSVTRAIGRGGPWNSGLFLGSGWQRGKLMYIKLAMYLVFYMAPGLNDFDGGKSITRAIERSGPWKSGLVWALEWQWAKLMYIKLPMHSTCFFIWRLDLLILMRANPLLGPLEGVNPENLVFLGPSGNWFARYHFRAQKV